MNMKHCWAIWVVVVLMLGAVSPLRADIIGYGVRSDGDDQLYQINLTTGTVTAIGAVGFTDVEGLSFQPGTGVLFGWDDGTNQLITVNLLTGAGTAVGPSGVTTLDVGLTFDAAGNLWLADEGGMGFWSVNPITGAATFIGSTSRDITALAASNGTIYGIDDDNNQFVTINTATGASTLVGGLGFDVGDAGIDFDTLGTLWELGDDGRIFTINPMTGVATLVHAASETRNGFEGLAVQQEVDSDGDGIPDDDDDCAETPAGAVVNAEGCAIVQLCPCEDAWKNHGAYVRCVAHAAEDFVAAGLITEAEKDAIVSEAGASSCGHKHK